LDSTAKLFNPPAHLTVLQRIAWYELTGYMRNTLLRDSDVFSMAHALELRVPIVDLEVAKAAFSAAGAIPIRRGSLKPVLVEAVRDLLSRDTIENPKRGFTLPFETWMRREMSDEVQSVFSTVSAESIGLRPGAVQGIWKQFLQRRSGVNWSRPWALYTLMRWAQEHGLAEMNKPSRPMPSSALSAAG
jgi:asparagine synthase (glutamine-hydrolysing)